MDYCQAETFLQGLTDYEKVPSVRYSASNYDLRRMELLLGLANNPHTSARAIHIAGTKGKGSTAAMLASVLSSSSHRTGRFTSPHLFSWCERIAMNGQPVSEEDFARLATSIQPMVIKINEEARFGRLTTFEVVTAMAFLYFRDKKADFVVLETGMGGRLDATNVVTPEVCVITSISLDHTRVLGNTLRLIAAEKAGIIKPGCVVVSAPQPPEAATVIEQKCRSLRARLIKVGEDITFERIRGDLKRQSFYVKGLLDTYELTIPLLGDFQVENAATAVATIEVLQQKGVKINCSDIVGGLSKVKWLARMQILSRRPLLVIDGAHNSYSVKRVIESIRKYFACNRAMVIFGASQDKDIQGMAREMAKFASLIIIARSSHPRAATAESLITIFQKAGLKTVLARHPAEALQIALANAGKKDMVLATGSLFLAADIQREFNEGIKRRRRHTQECRSL